MSSCVSSASLRSYSPRREYMNPLRTKVGGDVGYSSYQMCVSKSFAWKPPSPLGTVKSSRARKALSRYSLLREAL